MKQNDWKIAACLAGMALLGGCALFDGSGGIPPQMKDPRPGADRTAPVVKALPPPESNHPRETGVVPADETVRGAVAVGSTLQDKGGQKAQKEEAEKQAIELSRKAREERAQREAGGGKAAPPAEAAPAATPAPAADVAPESPTPKD